MSFIDRLKRIKRAYAPGLTAANMLDRSFEAHPDVPIYHLLTPLPYPGLQGPTLTCRQLLGFANRLGNVLREAGMQRYDRVAVFKTNGPDYFFLALAIIKAGGISVPINPGMGLDELRYYLQHTGVRLVITDERLFAERIRSPDALPMVKTWVFPRTPPGFTAQHVDLSTALERASDALEPVPLNRDSDILIIHTSGTTGFPKGVISTSGAFIQGLRGHMVSPLPSNLRMALATPFNHLVSHGMMASVMFGRQYLWTVDRFQAREVLEFLQRERIQIFAAFNDAYLRMYEEGLEPYDLSSMRFWLNAADAAHDVHMHAFAQKGVCIRLFGKPLLRSVFFDGLGSSEVGSAALARAVFSFTPLTFQRRIGKPRRFGPRVKVADEHGNELPPGQVGRIMVTDNTLFKGYWNAHDKLHGVMHDGWWWTGDVGYRDRSGFFYHLDRAVDVIHTSAGPVYSLLFEELLLSHPDVSEVAVIGVPKPGEGTVPVAVMYPKRGHTLDVEAVRAWANEKSKQPRGLEAVIAVPSEGIPRGLTGKVLKRVLRERHAACFQSELRIVA